MSRTRALLKSGFANFFMRLRLVIGLRQVRDKVRVRNRVRGWLK